MAKLQPVTLPALVLLLALLPRVGDLDRFLIADENNQLAFCYQFLASLYRANPTYTLISGYPGIPPNALGALGLKVQDALSQAGVSGLRPLPATADIEAAVAELRADPLAYIVAIRLPLAIVGALSVLGVYLLVRRLFGERAALLSAVLLALDPLFLAQTRINHVDGPLAYWTILAFLCLLLFLQELRYRWLILSAVTGGLALLTKSPALSLAPMTLFCFAVYWAMVWRPAPGGRQSTIRAGLALLAWAAILAGTFIIPWLVIGQNPLPVIWRMAHDAARAMSLPHDKGTFFLGQPRLDPGPWFYPVDVVLRTTPLSLVGLLACLLGLILDLRKKRTTGLLGAPTGRAAAVSLFAYLVLFTLMLTPIAKKGDRYVIPLFPPLDVLAAVGWAWLFERFVDPDREPRKALPVGKAAFLAFLALQSALVLPLYPYFLAYYNPLVGGPWQASEVISVGLGEGLDQAARYLNEKQDSQKLKVASWYSWQFAPYFSGRTFDLSSVGSALGTDYTVFYVNQVQRKFPDPELVDFFMKERRPEQTISLGGIEYAWIYPGMYGSHLPESVQNPLGVGFGGKLRLLGYDVADQQIAAGKRTYLTLYWQVVDKMPEDYNVTLRLTDDEGEIWGRVDRYPLGGFLRTSRWGRGAVVRDEYRLGPSIGTPPGQYRLEVGVYSPTTGEVLAPSEGAVVEGARLDAGRLSVVRPDSWPAAGNLNVKRRFDPPLSPGNAGIKLVGLELGDGPFKPGEDLDFSLYWRAVAPQGKDCSLTFCLARPEGGEEAQCLHTWEQAPLKGRYPTGRWTQGEIVRDPERLRLPSRLQDGEYELRLALCPAQKGDFVSLAQVKVAGRPHAFQEPPIASPLPASLGDKIEMLGYSLNSAEVSPGGAVRLTLYWKALVEMDTSYTVFIHLLDEKGEIYGQHDALPGDGAYPTTGWLAGEILTDTHALNVGLETPPGSYRLAVGLYDATGGVRLSAQSSVAEVSQHRVLLADSVRVGALPPRAFLPLILKLER